MRLLPWRGTQPQDPASLADTAKLHERLASLTKPPVPDSVPAIPPVSAAVRPAMAKLQELKGGAATQAGAPTAPERTETKPPVQDAVPASPAVNGDPDASSLIKAGAAKHPVVQA